MSWHVHPDVILWVALLEGGYLYALRQVGRPHGLSPTRMQVCFYTAGVATIYVGAGTPIHDLAEQRLFMIHMIQHMLFTLVAPPLLLLGIPGWLLQPLLRGRGIMRVVRALTRPVVAFTLFNLITFLTHLPPSVDATLHHHILHFFVHTLLTASALLMWWPILSPVPELPRISPPLQMIYLFMQSFVPTVLASFITFSSHVLYTFYLSAPRTWGISPITDQRSAGLIMKLGGGAILWLAIGIVFFTWVAREERKPEPPDLRWEDVEDELGRMGLTKPSPTRNP